jgi:hypothetical protein
VGAAQGVSDNSVVRLPHGAEPPYEVYVNGVLQTPAADYDVRGNQLVFTRHLEKEGKLGFWRWLSMALSIAGSYGRNDSVDVRYTLAGTRQIAVGLDIEAPNLSGDEDRPDHR